MSAQPEALRLAREIEVRYRRGNETQEQANARCLADCKDAASELRRLHADGEAKDRRIAHLEATVSANYGRGHADAHSMLTDRIAELERQLEEARKDAERYRWLREHRVDDVDPDGIAGATYKDLYFRWYSPIWDKGVRQQPVDIDAAIDAAMQKGQS